MARQNPSDVDELLKKEDDEVYGEGTASGSAPDPDSDDDVAKIVKDVTGEEPETSPWGFNMADEIEEDEKAIEEGDLTEEDEAAEADDLDDEVNEDGLHADDPLLSITDLEDEDGVDEITDDEENQ